MNKQTLRFVAVATVIVSIMGAGCAGSTKIDAPSTPMTLREARKSLVQSLSQLSYCKSVRDVRFTKRRLTFTGEYTYESTFGENVKHKPFDFTVTFADLGSITIDAHWVYSNGKQVLPPAGYTGYFREKEAARTFANCLVILRMAALAPDTEEADFTAFSTAAQTWLAAESKPPMPDAARLGKVKAEDAFKRKDFAAAMDAYVEALGIYPMWPEGHYNAALLAAEVEDFEVATKHMRRYLALAPDAKDASAAKDKYLLWQDKAKQ